MTNCWLQYEVSIFEERVQVTYWSIGVDKMIEVVLLLQ